MSPARLVTEPSTLRYPSPARFLQVSLWDQQVAALPHSTRAVGFLCLTRGPQPAPASWLEEGGCCLGPDPTRGQALSSTILHVHSGALELMLVRKERFVTSPVPSGL